MDGCDEKLLDFGGAGEAVDCAAAEVEVACDGAKAVAMCDAFGDLLVAFAGAGGQRSWPSVIVRLSAVWASMERTVFGLVIGEVRGCRRSARCRPMTCSTGCARLFRRCQASATCLAYGTPAWPRRGRSRHGRGG